MSGNRRFSILFSEILILKISGENNLVPKMLENEFMIQTFFPSERACELQSNNGLIVSNAELSLKS